VARCFRDEDLRADRQPEFTQLDMEMSFVEEDDVFAAWERVLCEVFEEVLGEKLTRPFPRMRWKEAMRRFGSDKPDLRIPLELVDARAWAEHSEFGVFRSALEQGGSVCALVVPGSRELSRKDLAALEETAKGEGAKGLAWWKASRAGGSGPLAKFCAGARAGELMELLRAGEGDTCLFVADGFQTAHKSLGAVRLAVGRSLLAASRAGNSAAPARAFLWVTHFPLFQYDRQAGRWVSEHHPFTAPEDWDLGGARPGVDWGVLDSRAYDLVYNGWELGSGSVRIHRADVQQRIFEILGLSPQEQERKFGFLLEALSFGAPPHAGFALGLDRCVALALGLDNIREVVAFPKTASAADLMCGAPSSVDPSQLAEVHVRTVTEAKA
jgi:aspartyl-tRNA synthetase